MSPARKIIVVVVSIHAKGHSPLAEISVALRRLRNPHEAEEVTQTVFIILARKAGGLRQGTVLSGWLYQTALLTAANFQRSKMRRQQREHEAFMQLAQESESDAWPQLSSFFEDAMSRLRQKERDAIILRFFENRSMTEVAMALGLREAAAQKRVNRATDKLREFFVRRGIQVSTHGMLSSIGAYAVQTAPPGLACSITTAAAVKGALATASTFTLAKGALKFMAWTNTKTAIVIGIGVLLAAGTTTVVIERTKASDSWRVPNLNADILEKTPPQTRILPTKFSNVRYWTYGTRDDKWGAIDVDLRTIAWAAYDCPPGRIFFPDGEPREQYDAVSTLPRNNARALREVLKNRLGLVGRRTMKDVGVLVLKVRQPNASGLNPPIVGSGDDWWGAGEFRCGDLDLSSLAGYLESYLGKPVINETGLTANFHIDLKWDYSGSRETDPDALKQALLAQLGLELVPGHQTVEMVAIEKAN